MHIVNVSGDCNLRVATLIRTDGRLAGERVPLLIDDKGVHAYSLMWSVVRRGKYTPNTRDTALNCLVPLRLWASISSVDVEQKMVWGECLTHEEITDLEYYIGLRRRDLRTLVQARPVDVNRFLATCNTVVSETQNLRRIYINDYLMFLGDYGNNVLRRTGRDDEHLMRLRKLRLQPAVRDHNRRSKFYVDGSISKQLIGRMSRSYGSRMRDIASEDVLNFALFFASKDPCELWPNNPDRALRNELIIKLLLQTGGRVSEILMLKDTDLKHRNHYIEFPRRHNDPEDPRDRPPVAKTYDRQLRLAEATWSKLMEWLDIQDEITASNPTGFLFVNLSRNPKHFGRPMSRVAVDQIIRGVCRAAGVAPFGAHQLRHLYVQNLAAKAREQGWTNEEWRKAATYLLGWSLKSKMPALYLGEVANIDAEEAMTKVWTERGLIDG